jgi:hypothetical protein
LWQGSSPEARHREVVRWTRFGDTDIASKEFVFVPMCDGTHWTLAIICHPGLRGKPRQSDGRRFMILFMDSLGGYAGTVGQILVDYLRWEKYSRRLRDAPGKVATPPKEKAVAKGVIHKMNVPRQVVCQPFLFYQLSGHHPPPPTPHPHTHTLYAPPYALGPPPPTQACPPPLTPIHSPCINP